MVLWTCPQEWPNSTVFILAGGPSAAAENLDALKGHRLIAINSSIFTAPFADFLIFGDSRWYFYHRPALDKMTARMVSTSAVPFGPHVVHMKKVIPPPGFTLARDSLVMERTTLQAAINLAIHLGASRVVTIGADMKLGPNGKTHHHPPHIWALRQDRLDQAREQLRLIGKGAKRLGIEIINTSMDSAIDFWPKRPLKDCLDG